MTPGREDPPPVPLGASRRAGSARRTRTGRLLERWWPLGALAGLTIVFFWKIALTGLILVGYDTFAYFYPYQTALAESFRQLRLPLWNPYVFMGAPLLANLQAAVFYPPTALFYLLPVPYAQSLDVMLHVLLAGCFTYLLARQVLGLGRVSAMGAGVAFAFSGFLGAQAGHVNQLSATVWLPLLLLCFDRAYRRRSVAYTLLTGAVIALTLLAGHSQEAYMIFCAFGGYFLWLSAGGTRRALSLNAPPGRTLIESIRLAGRMIAAALRANACGLATVAAAALVGAGLAAVQLLPSIELAGLSVRSGGMAYRQAVSFSLNPLNLPQALLPGYWDNPFSEYVGYVGVVGLVLAGIGALTSWRKAQAGYFVALAAAGLVLALGGYTPIYLFGYALVPGFGLFRVPARWLCLYTFGIAMLVGLGLEWLSQARAPGGRPSETPEANRRSARLGDIRPVLRLLESWHPLVPVVVASVAMWATHALRLPPVTGWVSLTLCAAWLAAVSALGAVRRGLEAPRSLLVILLAVELFAASRDLEYNHPAPVESLTSLRPALAHLLTDSDQFRILSLSLGLFDPGDLAEMRASYPGRLSTDFATAAKNKEVLAPNTPMVYGIESLDGYDGGILPLRRYVELQQLFLNPWQVSLDGRLREHLTTIPDGRLLNLLNVKYVILDKTQDAWVDGVYYDLGSVAFLGPDSPAWRQADIPIFPTSSLGMVSYLTGTVGMAEGTVVATVTLTDESGRASTFNVRAGRDTDQAEPKTAAKARVVSTWQNNPQAKNYWTRFTLDDALGVAQVIRSIEVRYVAPSGQLAIRGLSLVDDRTCTGQSLVVSSSARLRLVHSGDVKVYRNLDVLPRAFVVHKVQVMQTNRAVLDMMQDASFRPAIAAPLVADGLDVSALRDIAAGGQADSVQVAAYAPERVRVAAKLGANGLLVLADSWYPGWKAYVNGKETPIYRTYHLFRGVYVPAGEHSVEFVYEPASLLWGALISLVTLGGVVAVLWVTHRRRRAAPLKDDPGN